MAGNTNSGRRPSPQAMRDDVKLDLHVEYLYDLKAIASAVQAINRTLAHMNRRRAKDIRLLDQADAIDDGLAEIIPFRSREDDEPEPSETEAVVA